MNQRQFLVENLYTGLYDSWNGWNKVPGRFYMEPIISEDFPNNAMIDAFGLNIKKFKIDKNYGFNVSGQKRISVKFVKNLHLNIKDIGFKKYHWSGEMNFAGLLIHARFQKINNQWYTICYVCPEIVEKSRY